MNVDEEWVCPSCRSRYFVKRKKDHTPSHFCPFCGATLPDIITGESTSTLPSIAEDETQISFLPGQAPNEETVQYQIGPYQILETIGKGGMGEVMLAYDPHCGRRIALKCVRNDLKDRKQLYGRFLKEARITSQLTHPGIIPIYSIHDLDDRIFYTMPYIKGETLKDILRRTRTQEKQGDPLDHVGGSIPALCRILIHVCQAISYTHSNHVLHRDLKPENIMVGEFGEVVILDWGLAKLVKTIERQYDPAHPSTEKQKKHHQTELGKVVGTIAYMAPERAMGLPATVQTDIYSLGVILYQMLTLRLPFRRGTIAEFRKKIANEKWTEPSKVSPYREVPPMLSTICKRCLEPDPIDRYQSVSDLIKDLENFIEGRSDWFPVASLDPQIKKDWEVQAHVLLAQPLAITSKAESAEWVTMMISKRSFASNVRLELRLKLSSTSNGIGILLNVPEAEERQQISDGYCLWLGVPNQPGLKLFRSAVEVHSDSSYYLEEEKWVRITLEKLENTIHLFINGELQFTYFSHLPLFGTHVGLITKDDDYQIDDFTISQGSLHVMVNCLAVPDAFLAHKEFQTALNEYRRIAYSFPGRAEGREAQFRAGITLMEQGRCSLDSTEGKRFFDQALDEFEKLHSTPGAPFEYLGKGLVYQHLGDWNEEIKCYSLTLRRYPAHPLLPALKEHLVNRMHEYTRYHRPAAYHLILLAIQHCPDISSTEHSKRLFDRLIENWEPLPFLDCDSKEHWISFATRLSFWLGKPYFIEEIFGILIKEESPSKKLLGDLLFALLHLKSWEAAEACLGLLPESLEFEDEMKAARSSLLSFQSTHQKAWDDLKTSFSNLNHPQALRSAEVILNQALDDKDYDFIIQEVEKLFNILPDPSKQYPSLQSLLIWARLASSQWNEAKRIFDEYSYNELISDQTLLFFLYGCWLLAHDGEEVAKAHFTSLHETLYPRTWCLGGYHVIGKVVTEGRWEEMSFPWERAQLFRQLSLWHHCQSKESYAQDLYTHALLTLRNLV